MTPAQQRPNAPSTSVSWWPAIFGALSFITCCFPLGLIGAGLGVRALLTATREGRSPPVQSIVAMVLGVLSVGSFSWMAVIYQRDADATMAQKSAALEKVATTRKAEQLDDLTACILAEAFLLDTQVVGAATVTCPQPLQSSAANSASLPGVIYKRTDTPEVYTVCFVRSEGSWMAWGGLRFGSCPAPPVGADEAELRTSGKPLLEKALITSWQKTLPLLDAALEGDAPEKCPKLEGDAKVLDATLLNGDPGEEAWEFLSSDAFVGALKKPTAKSANEALEGLGQYVVILESDERVLPTEISDESFTRGSWEGRLSIVDVAAKKVVCGAPLSFANSATLGGGVEVGLKIGPKVGVGEESPEGNLEKNADLAVLEVVSSMTGGKLHVSR